MKPIVVSAIAVLLFLLLPPGRLVAQDVPASEQKFILFPHGLPSKWRVSLGITSTTMPEDITEELRFRIPAIDVHALRRLAEKWTLDMRLSAQGLQNLVSVGPRWIHRLNDRNSVAFGNDIAFWFGFINTGGIRTRGMGLQNYPSISFGHRFNKRILFTLRAESIMNLSVNTRAGNTKVSSDYSLFSGSAYTVALEQPFYKEKYLTLGFRAMYTNYFWQTWTLFESYDRNLFFPQIIVGLIL